MTGKEILQQKLPFDVHNPRPLPGVAPMDWSDWLIFDEAYAGQMAERDRLLTEARAEVVAMASEAEPAAQELLSLVLEHAYSDHAAMVERPDGVRVPVDRADPLGTLGRLVQQDFCILQKHGDEHVLTGAVLCFPASWTLAEKYLRPLTDIHVPVASYDPNIARRVQRLFDGIQAARPLWRFNALWYADATLHQPRSAGARRPRADPENAPYLRSERQSLLRLPACRAVVFGIHTFVLRRADAMRSAA